MLASSNYSNGHLIEPKPRAAAPNRTLTPFLSQALFAPPVEESLLERNLRTQGLQMINIERDGNCLFHSLGAWLHGAEHSAVRQIVVEYIASCPSTFEPDILASGYENIQQYCEQMSQLGQWGDAIVLQAFILMTGVNVRLFTEYGFSDLNPDGSQHLAIVQLQGHYQPAIPIQQE